MYSSSGEFHSDPDPTNTSGSEFAPHPDSKTDVFYLKKVLLSFRLKEKKLIQ